ncbi:permease [Streptomyces sp. PRh5]|uniref:ABC transporter permease n=1 Tax=Streptomyces sp. PRh5 TaxID=1158056 RepID=UPI0004455FD8|nr:ABC transporter permease [Streptomyces sp. PRh5]EXU63669.1 permease [Streptomyces sp. PRh5]
MLHLSWSNFVERWTLFIGAIVTVCLGVALVQSSLLLLLTVATLDAPSHLSALGRMEFTETKQVAVTLIAVTLAFSAFLAVFIIGSTFAFTVAERRRDFALLRLVGGDRRQLRRMLLGEAVLLGAIGAAVGIPVGVAVMSFQTWLLNRMRFVPVGFEGEWRGWILAVSVSAGIGLAVAGVLLAARRASRVRPLEALHETGKAAHVMTRGRWIIGLLFAMGAGVLIGVSPAGGPAGGQAMAEVVSLCAALAFTAMSPRLVTLFARLLPVRSKAVIGTLAKANLRDGVRRSASTAAPLIVLVGLVLGQFGALTSFAASGQDQKRAGTVADLVVEANSPVSPRFAAVRGLAHVSTEIQVPVAVRTGNGEMATTEIGRALIVDPAAYPHAHPGSGSLDALRGKAVAAGPGGDLISRGDHVGARIGDTDLGSLPVVAKVPEAMSGGAALILPSGLVPASALADATSQTFVTLSPGADEQKITQALSRIGTVRGLDDWLDRDAAESSATSADIFVVVMGLGGMYALVGVINAVVIAAASRRSEFAAARATGLTRKQVGYMALAEAWAVTAIGLVFGGLAAAGTYVAVVVTTAAVTGTATLVVPWTLILAIGAGAFLVTGATSVLTSWWATRPSPVTLLGARE